MAAVYLSGPCIGSYEPKNTRHSQNIDTFDANITSLYIDPAEFLPHYNKVSLEEGYKGNLNPAYIRRVFVNQDNKLKVADFTNTIIAPANIKVENKIESLGSVGSFDGTFYGTLEGELRDATVKDISPSAARILPEHFLRELGYDPNNPQYNQLAEEPDEIPAGSGNKPWCPLCRKIFGDGFSDFLRSCLGLLWQLLLLLLLFFLILWLLGNGCKGCKGGGGIFPPVPCDTLIVHDTIIIRDTVLRSSEVRPPDTLRHTVITQDSIMTLSLYDCVDVDGDRIKLYYNNALLSSEVLLSSVATDFEVNAIRGENIIKIKVLETPESYCTVGVILRDKSGSVIFEDCMEIDDKKTIEIKVNYH